MAHTITFINEKGGIGKSSMCFNTAWCFSQEMGKKVLLIDLDPQRANLTFFAGIEKPDNLPTIYDVLVEGKDVKETVLVVRNNLHIIPATADVSSLSPDNTNPNDMKRIIQELSPYYDLIYIDVSPTPNISHVLALAAADSVIIPMLPDVACLEANMGIIESIGLAKESFNPELRVLGIVFNRYTFRSRLSWQTHEVAQEMANSIQSKVLDTKIRQTQKLSENIGQNLGITSYAPKSDAARDVRDLCAEILKEV